MKKTKRRGQTALSTSARDGGSVGYVQGQRSLSPSFRLFQEAPRLPNSRSTSVLSKGFVGCERCEIPLEAGLHVRKFHTTWYNSNLALSPLCDSCWSALTLSQRMQFYRVRWTYLSQIQGYSAETADQLWQKIRRAVTAESEVKHREISSERIE